LVMYQVLIPIMTRYEVSHYRPGQTHRAPRVWGSQNFKKIYPWRWL